MGCNAQQTHLRTMVAAVGALRGAAAEPFDVVVSGETPSGQPAQTEEHVAAFAAAGATWWLESFNPARGDGRRWSFARLRERVLAGPLGNN